jgi:hypothetical protein
MELTVDFAAPADDAGIRGLLRRQAMPGRISLAFSRDPDFSLGCAITGDDYKIVVARSADEIVGVACRSVRHAFINGRPERLGYLGQLRVDERFRGCFLVSRGFSLLAQLDRQDPVPAYLASIVDGNHQATGVLVQRRRRSFPQFREIAAFRTLAIPTKRRPLTLHPLPARRGEGRGEGQGENIMAGSLDQVPEIVAFLRTEGSRRQLFPVWTEEALRNLGSFGLKIEDIRVARRGGSIVGVIGLWDQSAYKQAIVRGYSGWMRIAKPFLPRVGEEIRSAYASLICASSPVVFASLLREIYNLARERRFDYLLVGFDARDPLLDVARAYSHIAYPSRLYLASWSNGGNLYEQLDHRPVYVDIATL